MSFPCTITSPEKIYKLHAQRFTVNKQGVIYKGKRSEEVILIVKN